jgi:hypothetical protein
VPPSAHDQPSAEIDDENAAIKIVFIVIRVIRTTGRGATGELESRLVFTARLLLLFPSSNLVDDEWR